MKNDSFVRRSHVAAPAGDVFRWHTRPGAFERLTPPWEAVEVLEPGDGVTDGSRVVVQTRIGPLQKRWIAEHFDYQDGR